MDTLYVRFKREKFLQKPILLYDRSQTGEGLAPVGALGHKDPLSPSQAFVGVY